MSYGFDGLNTKPAICTWVAFRQWPSQYRIDLIDGFRCGSCRSYPVVSILCRPGVRNATEFNSIMQQLLANAIVYLFVQLSYDARFTWLSVRPFRLILHYTVCYTFHQCFIKCYTHHRRHVTHHYCYNGIKSITRVWMLLVEFVLSDLENSTK